MAQKPNKHFVVGSVNPLHLSPLLLLSPSPTEDRNSPMEVLLPLFENLNGNDTKHANSFKGTL